MIALPGDTCPCTKLAPTSVSPFNAETHDLQWLFLLLEGHRGPVGALCVDWETEGGRILSGSYDQAGDA
eukprot:1907778-Amphidinium_carterae.1